MVLCLPPPLLLACWDPGGGGGGCLCRTFCGWLVWWMADTEARLLRFLVGVVLGLASGSGGVLSRRRGEFTTLPVCEEDLRFIPATPLFTLSAMLEEETV